MLDVTRQAIWDRKKSGGIQARKVQDDQKAKFAAMKSRVR